MEPGLREMLGRIRAEGRMAYKAFADPAQLRELLLNDLAALLTERFGRAGEHRGPAFSVPVPLTPLVGRERDVREVSRLVRASERRLS